MMRMIASIQRTEEENTSISRLVIVIVPVVIVRRLTVSNLIRGSIGTKWGFESGGLRGSYHACEEDIRMMQGKEYGKFAHLIGQAGVLKR